MTVSKKPKKSKPVPLLTPHPEWVKGHTSGYQLGLKYGRRQLQMQIQELLDVPSWEALDK